MMLMLISGSSPHSYDSSQAKLKIRCLKHRETGWAQNLGGPGLEGHPVRVHVCVDVDLRLCVRCTFYAVYNQDVVTKLMHV